jgi:hypothetical protein
VRNSPAETAARRLFTRRLRLSLSPRYAACLRP